MHGRDERAGFFGVHVRVDAVTEVEHMPVAMTITGKHPLHFLTNALVRTIEHVRVHIAL